MPGCFVVAHALRREGGGGGGQRVEEQGTWASQKHSEAGYGAMVHGGTPQTTAQPAPLDLDCRLGFEFTYDRNLRPPPPHVTFRRVVASLWGPGQSPVLPFACCVGSLLSVG